MGEILTVDTLLKQLTAISKDGGGDLKIKCGDCYLHDDEISCIYGKAQILWLRGHLFNEPIAHKLSVLQKNIKAACDEFYGFNC